MILTKLQLNNGFEVLSDIEHVRKRPGMYTGSMATPQGILTEVVDNALDEALNSYASNVELHVNNETGEVIISDNGRGMPQGVYADPQGPYDGYSITELIHTKLFSSAKFTRQNYYRSIGLHGVGLVVCNALSEFLTCCVYANKQKTTYYFVDAELKDIKVEPTDRPKRYTGTIIHFKPSIEYYESLEYDLKPIERRLKMFRYLYPKCVISVNNENIEVTGLEDIHSTFESNLPLIEIKEDNFYLAFTYNLEDTTLHKYGYVNLLPVNEGTHLIYVNSILRNVWSELAGTHEFERDDCFLGLSVLFSVYLENAQFSSQTKERLISSKLDIKDVCGDLEAKLLTVLKSRKYFESFTKPLLIRFHEYRRSMKRLRVIDYVKEAIKYGDVDTKSSRVSRKTTVKKLFDCTSSSRDETELFIVEGQSAGGSILQCRDLKIHAVLPLRGKPLNPMNTALDKIVANVEFRALINAIGTGVAPLERVENIRYSKIILVSDADPDGKAIEAILLGAFLKLFPELVNSGYLYVCDAPLFWQKSRGFVWDFKDLNLSKPFQRFKGLGEMNPDQIQEAIVNPSNRRLHQVSIIDGDDKNYAIQLVSSSVIRKIMLRTENIVE